MNKLEMVKERRRTFGLPVSEKPVVPSADQLRLHAKLISDEAQEILDAASVGGLVDEIKLRDVAVDLLYFALGLMCEAGIDFKGSLTWYQAESQKLEDTHDIFDVNEYIQARCESFVEEVEFGRHETCTISEFAHDIATNAMLLLMLKELEDYLDSDFSAVHSANMAKLWNPTQLMGMFQFPDGWFNHPEPFSEIKHDNEGPDGLYTITKAPNVDGYIVRLNGKVQKPPGWKAAVLEGGAV